MFHFQIPQVDGSKPPADINDVPPVLVGPSPGGGTAYFERSGSPGDGAGGFLRDPKSGYGIHITGTDAKGAYIQSQVVKAQGSAAVPDPPPKFAITDKKLLIDMFDLRPVQGASENYTRPGFKGQYSIYKDTDGAFALFYSGGEHDSGPPVQAQTFHHGAWDVTRVTRPNEGERDIRQTKPDTPPPQSDPLRVPEPPGSRPSRSAEWKAAVEKIASSIKENGALAASDRGQGFAAALYSKGAFSSFHKDYPQADLANPIPYDVLGESFGALRRFCVERRNPEAQKAFRADAAASDALVVTKGLSSPIYFFPTESSVDGFGVIILGGGKGMLPPEVQKAYDAAAKSRTDGGLVTNEWLCIDKDDKRFALVRTNGQVLFCEAPRGEAAMFDPLQAILKTAQFTAKQRESNKPSWTTLADTHNKDGGYQYRRVTYESGFWRYTQQDVPTLPPIMKEPPPPNMNDK